jgi:hypothetical protein
MPSLPSFDQSSTAHHACASRASPVAPVPGEREPDAETRPEAGLDAVAAPDFLGLRPRRGAAGRLVAGPLVAFARTPPGASCAATAVVNCAGSGSTVGVTLSRHFGGPVIVHTVTRKGCG